MKSRQITSRRGQIVRQMWVVEEGPPRMELPIWVAEGHASGPTMLLTCAIHGDEVNAIATLRRFLDGLDRESLRGRLIALPIVNVSGFRANQRSVPEDGRDLNRTFPGDPRGSFSQRLAHALLTEIVPLADVAVDIHDSGKQTVLLPHPRIPQDASPELLKLAALFGTDFIMTSTLPPGYEGVLPIEARRKYGIPYFTVEIGGSTLVWPALVERGAIGLRNLLAYYGMVPDPIFLPKRQFFLPGRDDLVRPAPIGGLVTRHVALGEFVTEGQPLVTIEEPISMERVVMRAPVPGIVHDLTPYARVEQGMDVVGVIELRIGTDGGFYSHSGPVNVRINEPRGRIRLREGDLLNTRIVLQI